MSPQNESAAAMTVPASGRAVHLRSMFPVTSPVSDSEPQPGFVAFTVFRSILRCLDRPADKHAENPLRHRIESPGVSDLLCRIQFSYFCHGIVRSEAAWLVQYQNSGVWHGKRAGEENKVSCIKEIHQRSQVHFSFCASLLLSFKERRRSSSPLVRQNSSISSFLAFVRLTGPDSAR